LFKPALLPPNPEQASFANPSTQAPVPERSVTQRLDLLADGGFGGVASLAWISEMNLFALSAEAAGQFGRPGFSAFGTNLNQVVALLIAGIGTSWLVLMAFQRRKYGAETRPEQLRERRFVMYLLLASGIAILAVVAAVLLVRIQTPALLVPEMMALFIFAPLVVSSWISIPMITRLLDTLEKDRALSLLRNSFPLARRTTAAGFMAVGIPGLLHPQFFVVAQIAVALGICLTALAAFGAFRATRRSGVVADWW
jgi:hypothetical protein